MSDTYLGSNQPNICIAAVQADRGPPKDGLLWLASLRRILIGGLVVWAFHSCLGCKKTLRKAKTTPCGAEKATSMVVMENINTCSSLPKMCVRDCPNFGGPKKAWEKIWKKHFLTLQTLPSSNLRSIWIDFLSFRRSHKNADFSCPHDCK